MSQQLYNSTLRLSSIAGLSAVAILMSSSGAFAASVGSPQPIQIAQTTNSQPDVIIDPAPQNSGSTTTTSSGTGSTTTANGVRFTCETVGGQPTVMYHPESQANQPYPWATPGAMGSSWSPERRCAEISRRLESYRPDGLVEMRTAVENGYNTICVTTEQVPTCRIVLTVPQGQDPQSTRDRVFQNLTVADSGQSTVGVNTYVGGRGSNGNTFDQLLNTLGVSRGKNSVGRSQNIYLRPFLDASDGGTGTQLRKNVSAPAGRRLNPRLFR